MIRRHPQQQQQHQQQQQPINVFQNEVAPGSINALRQITQTQYININSKYRNTPILSTPTNFQVTLPGMISRVSEIELSHVEIPAYGYYMISTAKQNNVFWVEVVKAYTQSPRYEIRIPDGNYTPQTLATYLNTTYFYQNTSTSNLFKNIEFVFDTTNFKCSFDIVDPSDITLFSVIFFDVTMSIDLTNTFGWQMGFMSPFYANFNGIEPSAQHNSMMQGTGNIEAEMPVNLFANRSLYLSVNDFQYNNNNNNLVLLKNNNLLDDYILGKIFLPGTTYENAYNVYAIDQILSFPRKYNGPVDLKKLEIKLYDEDGNIISLNGLDFSLTLKVVSVYETL